MKDVTQEREKAKTSFKLLAIRPLTGCNKKISKILEYNKIYKFYNDYDFIVENDDVIEINYFPSIPSDLFNVNDLQINISAIVGKNGSGKSSLLELFFAALYNLAVEYKILEYNPDAEEAIFQNQDKIIQFVQDIRVEVFYAVKDLIICFTVKTDKETNPLKITNEVASFKVIPGTNKNEKRQFELSNLFESQKEFINEFFFYSISINYSVYSLNSEQVGNWVAYLFHKNDGYQTPIVINPFRKWGNIDIGVENDLVKQRLLANLLEPVQKKNGKDLEAETLRNIAPNKIANRLFLKLNHGKIYDYNNKNNLTEVINGIECLEKLYLKYTGIEAKFIWDEPLLGLTKEYAITKLIRICTNYNRYEPFLINNKFEEIDVLIDKICKDSSHITFKIKQALNLLRHQHICNILDFKENEEFSIEIEALSQTIYDIKKDAKLQDRNLSTIELIPPSIFDIRIELNDGSDFDDCSSGEKQKIYSISSIVYHLINLNSVFNNGEKTERSELHKYQYVNILFDELELYFHPNLQRAFVFDFLNYIKNINPDNLNHLKGLNIIFLTHSPFILSDIPSANILILKEKQLATKEKPEQTFGANIHELLSNDFFLTGGTIGEHAKNQIQKAIDNLNEWRKLKKENLEEFKKNEKIKTEKERTFYMLTIIGDHIVRNKLFEMYLDVFDYDTVREKEISYLEEMVKKLQNKEK